MWSAYSCANAVVVDDDDDVDEMAKKESDILASMVISMVSSRQEAPIMSVTDERCACQS